MSRKIGDEFEDEVMHLLNLKKTPNSGAMFNDGDLTGKDCVFELKVKSDQPHFRVDKKELSKLQSQADRRLKDWVYIQRTKGGDQVCMDIELFAKLWKNYEH